MAIDRILLPVNSSDSKRLDALASAVSDVAGPTGATVELFHVFTEDRFEESVANLDFDEPIDADPITVARRQRVVRDLRDRLEANDVDVDVEAAVGDVAETIVAEAGESDADMAFIGGRKRSPAGKAVFGSTVQNVMLEAPCPVTFVRSE